MSLILVAARARPNDSELVTENASAGHWTQMLAGGMGTGDDGMTVEYAANVADASAAAERSIRDGTTDIVLIPIVDVDGRGGPASRDADELEELREATARLSTLDPQAQIVVATTPKGTRLSFTDVLDVLHPPDATDPALLAEAVHRAFGGDVDRFGRFVAALQGGVPPGTQLALRGSAVQGYSYKTLEPFDADGPASSDLDVVLFGDEAMAAWDSNAFFVPGVNTMPLGDESTWIAPTIEPARAEAQRIAGRPVNIQAMARWFMDLRSGLQSQPYVLLDT